MHRFPDVQGLALTLDCTSCGAPPGTPCTSKDRRAHAPRMDGGITLRMRTRVLDGATLAAACPQCGAKPLDPCRGRASGAAHSKRRAAGRALIRSHPPTPCPNCAAPAEQVEGLWMHRDWYNTVQCNDRLWGTDPARWGEPADVQPADPPTVPATATLLRDGSQRQWLLKITCPFCGKTHTHGGGDGETPAGYYGHRVAHCHGYASHPGYVLTDEHGGQP